MKMPDGQWRCDDCGLLPAAQAKRSRFGPEAGLCMSGRCVVRGTAWLVWPDSGEPLGFETPLERDLRRALEQHKRNVTQP